VDWKTIDFFFDESLVNDPYPYFEALRSECPVLPLDHLGVVAVTGYDELSSIYRNTEDFSSVNSPVGPFAQFSKPLEGDDLTEQIAQHRHEMPLFEHMVTMDPPDHTNERHVLMRLITPKRLQANEAFMHGLADRQLDEFIHDGHCEFITAYAQPFAMLAVADMLGVPAEDHEFFRENFGMTKGIGTVGKGASGNPSSNPLGWLDERFARYIEERREEKRSDVMSELACGTYPDGSLPTVTSVVRTATFLFAAGQETTARLLAFAIAHLAEHPELQDRLRDDKALIPLFLEECLRYESPVKADFRLAKKNTTVGGVAIKAGTPVMMLNGAANRDPRRFECPAEFNLDRENVQQHMAFGRGVHSCPGGPLARAEGRISLEHILDRTRNIRLSEEHHGPPDNRTLNYERTWVLRGLWKVFVEFEEAK
jgi:cytochrome P450